MEVFEKLFKLLLSPENVQRHGITAFDLTQYVCERLQPDREHAVGSLKHLIESLSRTAPRLDRRDDVVASVLLWLASGPKARSRPRPTEPKFAAAVPARFGGVDPVGLRQINFDLLDQVFPGLNNVARHIRPFVVVTWAWRRGG